MDLLEGWNFFWVLRGRKLEGLRLEKLGERERGKGSERFFFLDL